MTTQFLVHSNPTVSSLVIFLLRSSRMAAAQTAGIQNQAGQSVKAPGPMPNVQPGPAVAGAGSGGQQQVQAGAAGAQVALAARQERALVPAPAATEIVDIDTDAKAFGAHVERLPVELDVSIPLRDFRVRDLLGLERGRLIESEWSNGTDLPLAAGQVQLAWSEFEAIEAQLVVRLTRML